VAPSAVAAAGDGAPDASSAVQSLGRSSLPSIAGIAVANPDFSTLVAALQKAGLVETFDGARHYTVFAPTNAAFDAAAAALGIGGGGAGLVAALDSATLTSVLTYHVTRGDRNSTSVLAAGRLKMLDGNTTAITVSGGAAKIDNASIVAVDIRASNGIVHVIDGVLLPPSLR
jgi:transforming growth factor-beta-induced protein